MKVKLFEKDLGIHVAILLLLILPSAFSWFYIAKRNVPYYIINLVIRCGLMITFSYLNGYYIIPWFLNRPKKITRWITLVVAVIAFVAIYLAVDVFETKYFGTSHEYTHNIWEQTLFCFFNTCGYLVIAYLLYTMHEKNNQIRIIERIKIEKLEAEINNMKSQINPHFLFNTLNNIYGLALEKSEKAPEIILKLAKMMDYMLYDSNERYVYLKNEIENINNYVDMERIRNGNKAEIYLKVNGSIGDQKIVPLMILPIVENAFKYGLGGIVHQPFVDININIENQEFELKVNNNYTSQRDGRRNGHGIGISNLASRLKLFYPNHLLSIDDSPPFYSVLLKFNLSN